MVVKYDDYGEPIDTSKYGEQRPPIDYRKSPAERFGEKVFPSPTQEPLDTSKYGEQRPPIDYRKSPAQRFGDKLANTLAEAATHVKWALNPTTSLIDTALDSIAPGHKAAVVGGGDWCQAEHAQRALEKLTKRGEELFAAQGKSAGVYDKPIVAAIAERVMEIARDKDHGHEKLQKIHDAEAIVYTSAASQPEKELLMLANTIRKDLQRGKISGEAFSGQMAQYSQELKGIVAAYGDGGASIASTVIPDGRGWAKPSAPKGR